MLQKIWYRLVYIVYNLMPKSNSHNGWLLLFAMFRTALSIVVLMRGSPLYDSVFYADEDHFYCVNFFATIDREALRKFESHVANILDSTTDDSIRKKYLYLEHMIKHKLVVLEGENNA